MFNFLAKKLPSEKLKLEYEKELRNECFKCTKQSSDPMILGLMINKIIVGYGEIRKSMPFYLLKQAKGLEVNFSEDHYVDMIDNICSKLHDEFIE